MYQITLGGIASLHQSVPNLIHGGSAIAITLRSVAKVTSNYICGSASPIVMGGNSFNGISCMDSDMAAKQNLILNCSSRQLIRASPLQVSSLNGDDGNSSASNPSTTLGLHTGIFVKHRAKLELVDNFIQRCDVGIYVGKYARGALHYAQIC